jgi:flagellar biosynthesis/type III secretory pathway chaperone
MSETTVDVNTMLARLDRERELYSALRAMSRRQAEILEGESSVEEILELLGRKQALMGELEAVGRELTPLRREWPSVRGTLAPEDRAAVEGCVREAIALLEELLELEDRGRVTMAAQVAPAQGGSEHRRAAEAYRVAPDARRDAASIDHRG